MSTRSAIGFEYADGAIRGIYCHYDGYPAHVGEILREHYTDPLKILQLLDNGDLSSLGEEIGEKHNFNHNVSGWCKFYGRDRGESGINARSFPNQIDFLKHFDRMGSEYFYVFRNGKWMVTEGWIAEDGDWEGGIWDTM